MSDQAQRIELFARIFRDIGIVQERMDAVAKKRLPNDLPLAQYKLLDHLVYTLNRNETCADIARNSHVTKAAMSQIIKRLLEKGFVELRENPTDRRIKALSITQSGRAIHQLAQAAILPAIKPLSQTLSLTELEQTFNCVHQFRLQFESQTSV